MVQLSHFLFGLKPALLQALNHFMLQNRIFLKIFNLKATKGQQREHNPISINHNNLIY